MSSEPHNTFGTIGAYRLLTRLGKGGMGEVFRAYDQRLKRDVAIKRIRAERSFDQSARSRFRREAQAVARLSHPSIVPIFDVLDTEEGDCIVMEYVEGQSLAAFMEAGPIPVRTAVQIAGAIASGLGHAHDKGLIHRDLKPENVMLTKAPDGFGSTHQAKILDFGLARALASRPVEDLEAPLTEPGAVIGTVHAMSPEQAMGEEVDHRTDLFSLGALLYEMLTATSAFRGKNWIDTLNRVIHEDPAALDAQALGIPEELAELTMSLMAKKSAERPPSAGRVAAQLRKIDLRLAAESGGFQSLQTPAVGGSAGAAKDAPSTVAAAQVRTLVLVQLLDAARIAVSADTGGSNVLSRHDRDARNLATQLRGFEVEHADGFLAIFERPIDGVHFAVEYHRLVSELSDEIEEPLRSRAAVHLGEVFIGSPSSDGQSHSWMSVDLDAHTKTLTTLLVSLASPRQTLLTRGTFDIARRAAQQESSAGVPLHWLAHGAYVFRDIEDPVEVFEVGAEGFAPLLPPEGSKRALRSVAAGDEVVLGWRPAVGLPIPRTPNWTLIERIGEGGFGEVWLARHKSDEQRVFKFCFDAGRLRSLKREVTLFRLLKQSLGNRDDIARIVDWNFDEAPYFLVAEYTEGGSLVTWCQEAGGLEKIPLETRLELIAQVAVALTAAHSIGVLHKDVKPDNILVTTDQEGVPRIRLTDFGIGLLTDDTQLVGRFFTIQGMTGTQSAEGEGTRMYMAPELLEGKPSSVQADVYSLGVMLYQMVVGDFQRALAPGWRRDLDDELLADDIAHFVDGRPERRAGSALEVAKRLRSLKERREAAEREVQERREAHLARRALRRAQRRRQLATGVAAVALLTLALVLIFAVRERQARTAASREAQTSQRVTDFLVDLFVAADPFRSPGDVLTVREVLDRGTERVRGELSDEPEVQATLMHTMGDVYRSLGQFSVAIPLLEEAIETRTSMLGPKHPLLGRSLYVLGEAQCRGGQFEAGEQSLKQAHGIQKLSEDLELAAGKTLEALGHLCLQFRGDLDGAADALRESLDIQRRHLDPADPDIAEIEFRLALVAARQGRLEEALGLLQESLESKRAYYGRHPEVARVLINIAHTMWWQGEDGGEPYAREAVEIVTEKLKQDHPLAGVAHHIHAGPLQSEGRLDEAEAALNEALAIWERLGDRSFRRAGTLRRLAWLHIQQGDFGLAEALVDESLGIYKEEKSFESPESVFAKAIKGACLAARRDPAAESTLRAAFEILAQAGAANDRFEWATAEWLVDLYETLGEADKAAPFRAVLAERPS